MNAEFVLLLVLAKAVLWGAAENRLFNCNNNKAVLNGHLSFYHIWLFMFFSFWNSGSAYVLDLTPESYVVTFAALALWDILILDVTWWLIRYYHFKTLPYAVAVAMYFGELNSWHERLDWDAAGLPLLRIGRFRVYSWWPALAVAIAVLVCVAQML